MGKYSSLIFLAFVSVLVVGLFCAKKKNPAQWDNPQDNTGANWHPPTVVMMEGGAVPYRDTLYVTASATDSNGTILDYCWDVNGSGYHDTTLTGTLDVYLPDTGWYTVRVKARDNDKLFSQPDSVLLYATFHPPVVQGMPDFAVSIYDTFTLTATGTDSNGVITKYLWALDGVNYTEETMAGSLRTVFGSEGVKSVKVRAVDDDDLQSLPDEINVTVRLDVPEVTGMDDIIVSIYDTISITATSTDPNGSVISYHWAFDGLHFVDSTDTGFVQHVFDSAGVYEVKVKVKDDDGIFSVDDVVRIVVVMNAPVLTVMDDISISIFDSVALTVSAEDPNGSVMYYIWALNGSAYMDTSVTGTLKAVFSDSGRYPVTVKAVDDQGFLSESSIINVTVRLDAPTLTAMEDSTVGVGTDVILRAYADDANGTVERYYWAFNGEDYVDSTVFGLVHHSFAYPGLYSVKVKVRDDDGIFSTVRSIALVALDSAPNAVSPINNTSVKIYTSVSLNWTAGLYSDHYAVVLDTVDPPVTRITSNVADTFTFLGSLIQNRHYYWRITGYTVDGDSAMSDVRCFNTLIEYDTLHDTRTGIIYRTLEIGNQVWMADNLNFGEQILLSETPTVYVGTEKYYYNESPNWADTCGALYTWKEAMGYGSSEGAMGICPRDWHIPTKAECEELIESLGGMQSAGKYLVKGGGSGFDAVFAGFRATSVTYSSYGSVGMFWTSTKATAGNVNILRVYPVVDYAQIFSGSEGLALCVRCIRD